ncbi:MAG TPA: DUF169 domain-containing protein [Armatimonadota bacterium]|jgi:uncharacterized protein (DUF169 family)
MKSKIADRLRLEREPVAIVFADSKPEGALGFVEGKWGCVAALHVAASRGRSAAFDRKTFGCPGGYTGLGFGNLARPGMAEFLSTGTPERAGEHYWKTPELAQAFIDTMPQVDVPCEFVLFKPLSEVDEASEMPQVVTFYANADQISALVVLANYGRRGVENVISPMGAGCHTFCLYALAEARREVPRAVLGMFDITARPLVEPHLLTFSMPYRLFQEMEGNVEGSFLETHDWGKVEARLPGMCGGDAAASGVGTSSGGTSG